MTSLDTASDIMSISSVPDSREDVGNVPSRVPISSFDISHLSGNVIRKRELHAFSVHYSVPTSSWVTRIISYSAVENKPKCLSFSFATEADGRNFGKAYSPPKKVTGSLLCACCSVNFSSKVASCHCKNCGVQICNGCSRRWGLGMVPKTYLRGQSYVSSSTVRVCKSCAWQSNAFCMALLQGQHNNAVLIHAKGNVNLRCAFADIQKEAM